MEPVEEAAQKQEIQALPDGEQPGAGPETPDARAEVQEVEHRPQKEARCQQGGGPGAMVQDAPGQHQGARRHEQGPREVLARGRGAGRRPPGALAADLAVERDLAEGRQGLTEAQAGQAGFHRGDGIRRRGEASEGPEPPEGHEEGREAALPADSTQDSSLAGHMLRMILGAMTALRTLNRAKPFSVILPILGLCVSGIGYTSWSHREILKGAYLLWSEESPLSRGGIRFMSEDSPETFAEWAHKHPLEATKLIIHYIRWHESDEAIYNGFRWLSSFENPLSLAFIAESLSDERQDYRVAAVEAAYDTKNPFFLKYLFYRLSDSDEWIRLHAAEAIGIIGCEDSVARLLPLCKNEKAVESLPAACALAHLRHPTSRPILLKAITDRSSVFPRITLAEALVALDGTHAAPYFIPLLESPSTHDQTVAVHAIWMMSREAENPWRNNCRAPMADPENLAIARAWWERHRNHPDYQPR